MKTSVGLPGLKSAKLLDQLRERIRYFHYSVRTDDLYACPEGRRWRCPQSRRRSARAELDGIGRIELLQIGCGVVECFLPIPWGVHHKLPARRPASSLIRRLKEEGGRKIRSQIAAAFRLSP